MSPLPTNRLVTKIMRYLTEKYSSSRLPIVLAEDLIRDNALSKEEYQDLFHHLFRAGVFKPSGGKDRLQIDPLVAEYAPRLDHCSLSDVHQFFQGRKDRQRMDQILQAVSSASDTPVITVKALLTVGDEAAEGQLVEAVTIPWFEIMRLIEKDPGGMYQIDWRMWEEIIAGAYKQSGEFDEVILTPRSGDKGRDIIAIKHGFGSIRIFDQVKAYKPNHLVTADEVRSMIGVITADQNVSKGVITTTSNFAPGVVSDFEKFIPYRLELKPRDELLPWLQSVRKKSKS